LNLFGRLLTQNCDARSREHKIGFKSFSEAIWAEEIQDKF